MKIFNFKVNLNEPNQVMKSKNGVKYFFVGDTTSFKLIKDILNMATNALLYKGNLYIHSSIEDYPVMVFRLDVCDLNEHCQIDPDTIEIVIKNGDMFIHFNYILMAIMDDILNYGKSK